MPPYTFNETQWQNNDIYNLNNMFYYLYNKKQNIDFKQFSSVPATTSLYNKQIALYNSGTDYRLYSKINNSLKYITYNIQNTTNTWTGTNTFTKMVTISSSVYAKHIETSGGEGNLVLKNINIVHDLTWASSDNALYRQYSGGVLINQFYTNGNSYIMGGSFGISTPTPTCALDNVGFTKLGNADTPFKEAIISTRTAGVTGAVTYASYPSGVTSSDILPGSSVLMDYLDDGASWLSPEYSGNANYIYSFGFNSTGAYVKTNGASSVNHVVNFLIRYKVP